MKWVPAPNDAAALFRPWLALRRSQGGQPEELLFPCKSRQGRPYRKELLEARWEAVASKLGLRMTFYEATRHSFVSRSLSGGASLDEVSAAVGHWLGVRLIEPSRQAPCGGNGCSPHGLVAEIVSQ